MLPCRVKLKNIESVFVEGKKAKYGFIFRFLLSANIHFASWSGRGRGAKIQPFNLDGLRGKTRSHYLLVKGSEIDVRMEIISVLLYNNTIQATRTTDHGESSMKFQLKRFLLMMILLIHHS